MMETGKKLNTALAKEITLRLEEGEYECAICVDRVGRRGRVWACEMCHMVFHLTCVQQWWEAQKDPFTGAFPCPGCRLEVTDEPNQYMCFCRKRVDPPFNPYLTPHSCGEICGKDRGHGCPHACNLPCHPGHCPPCAATGDVRYCPCGQMSYRLRCGEPEREKRTCEAQCNKVLPCGKHRCEKACHNGDCGECTVQEEQDCFCGREQVQLRPCGTGVKHVHAGEDAFGYSCNAPCNRPLDCGNHRCERICHPGDCVGCVRMPQLPQPCACGRSKSMSSERASCHDPLPTCSAVCGAKLPCLHLCRATCHDSPCPPCDEQIVAMCRCGKREVDMRCAEFQQMVEQCPENGGQMLCNSVCKRLLSCKKHRCGRRCCEASTEPDSNRHPLHQCNRRCQKKLSCGLHKCSALCHLGFCEPCSVRLRDGVACACGKTRIPGPVLCGTAAPACNRPCSRKRACGHPCRYNCHDGDCPPCVFLVSKPCAGGHCVLDSVNCHVKNPSCGKPCGKVLPCGVHTCSRPCHGDACVLLEPKREAQVKKGMHVSCGMQCNQPRRACSHTCQHPCHPGLPCPVERCTQKVVVHCDCGRLSKPVQCGYGGTPPYTPASSVALPCDDQCLVEKRNRLFREALHISHDDERPSAHFIPYAAILLDQLIESSSTVFLLRMERQLAEFMDTKYQQTMYLPAMNLTQRWLVHQLASQYNIKSESLDSGPHRSVRLIKTPNSSIPAMLLSEALDKYQRNASSVRTVNENRILHFYNLKSIRGLHPDELRDVLRTWEGRYRLNWVDPAHAIAVFGSPEDTVAAREYVRSHGRFQVDDESDPLLPGEAVMRELPMDWRSGAPDARARGAPGPTKGDSWETEEETAQATAAKAAPADGDENGATLAGEDDEALESWYEIVEDDIVGAGSGAHLEDDGTADDNDDDDDDDDD